MHPSSTFSGRSANAGEIAMVPSSVARVARDWDDQQSDLDAAADLVSQAPTTGFTPRAGAAAADFLRAWTEHTGTAAEVCGHQAEALRSVMAAWLRSDDSAADRSTSLTTTLRSQP